MNTINPLALATVTTVVLFLTLLVFRHFFRTKWIKTIHFNETAVIFIEVIQEIPTFFLLALATYIGVALFPIPDGVRDPVLITTFMMIIFQIGVWLSRITTVFLEHQVQTPGKKQHLTKAAAHILGVMAKVGIWTVILMLILENIGFSVKTLLAGLGISSIAIALAVQNILGDVFASLSIVIDKPFFVGDFIVVDEFSGTVKQVGIKTTRIQSITGEELVIANNDLLKSRLRNYKKMEERRVSFNIKVTYQTPVEQLEAIPQIIKDIIVEIPEARCNRVHFTSYGESSLDFEVVFFVTTPDKSVAMEVQEKINLAIFRRFADEGISFAYPTRTVYQAS